jgi:AcrR family transcriptional regulator
MRADARRNRERLMDAAREAFAERGTDASLDDIAKRAGVGPGTLYRHFRNREELLISVYRHDVDELAAQADELAKQYPPEQAVTAYLRVQLDYIKQMRGMGAAVKELLQADTEMAKMCKVTLYEALGRLLTPAQEAGVIRRDAEPPDILRLVHGVARSTETAPDQADRLLGFVIDGLRPPAQPISTASPSSAAAARESSAG